tara:strand:+ start:1549 stop:2412 length:864 start_codon:yes stop_codon:yes gene_type:complete
MKEVKCDLCGENKPIKINCAPQYTNGQEIHICSNCGLVYVVKRRNPQEIAKAWSDELYGSKYTGLSPLMRGRHSYIAAYLDQEFGLKGKSLLDVGAGEGNFLRICKDDYQANVCGVEPSESNCKLLNELEIKSFSGTIEEFHAKNESGTRNNFDFVTLQWTLENCSEPNNILKICRDFLKPNGVLLVATGSRILVPFKSVLNFYFSHNPVDTHPLRFSKSTLEAFFVKHGFKPQFNSYFNDGILLCSGIKQKKPNNSFDTPCDSPQKVAKFFEEWNDYTKRFTELFL